MPPVRTLSLPGLLQAQNCHMIAVGGSYDTRSTCSHCRGLPTCALPP